MFITAAEVVNTAADSGQLVPMIDHAEELTNKHISITLAYGGYNTAANLEAGEYRGQTLVMAERYQDTAKGPYFKDQFRYDAETNSYICPKGQRLHFSGLREHKGNKSSQYRVYYDSRTICHKCPAYGICTKDAHDGRTLWIGSSDLLIRTHRQWMLTGEARQLYARRQQLIEPTFGILKDQMGARRFLLRGLANVRAEFILMATAFNLRVLSRIRNRTSTASQIVSISQPLMAIQNVFNLFKLVALYIYDKLASINFMLERKIEGIPTF
jgi:transposase